MRFEIFLTLRLGDERAMVRPVNKVLQVTPPEVISKVAHEAPKVVPETLLLSLFDIDPYIETEKPINIDLDLDQLEDEE